VPEEKKEGAKKNVFSLSITNEVFQLIRAEWTTHPLSERRGFVVDQILLSEQDTCFSCRQAGGGTGTGGETGGGGVETAQGFPVCHCQTSRFQRLTSLDVGVNLPSTLINDIGFRAC
jgi:hypothetical protein